MIKSIFGYIVGTLLLIISGLFYMYLVRQGIQPAYMWMTGVITGQLYMFIIWVSNQ